jgi:acyl-CoA reductase-like NAD-dependent aldehyde dehydrogenase
MLPNLTPHGTGTGGSAGAGQGGPATVAEDGSDLRGDLAARIHSEETFGPVLVAQPVDHADEAVTIANSTRYGLSAGLITGDDQRGFALARRIDAGAVHVNDQTVADEPQLPLGGTKDSGWGRSAPQSMADFTEVQWITTRDSPGHFPI